MTTKKERKEAMIAFGTKIEPKKDNSRGSSTMSLIRTNYLFRTQDVLVGNDLEISRLLDIKESREEMVSTGSTMGTVQNIMDYFKSIGQEKATITISSLIVGDRGEIIEEAEVHSIPYKDFDIFMEENQ